MHKQTISPIIGVMLMIAIVVAIVTTFYVFNNLKTTEKPNLRGWVYDAYQTPQTFVIENKTLHVWNITLVPTYEDYIDGTNKTSYRVVFNGPAPPPEGVELKLFYKLHNDTYEIYMVKSL